MSGISEKAPRGERLVNARGNVVRSLVSEIDPTEVGDTEPSLHTVTVVTWMNIEVEVEVTASGQDSETFLFNDDAPSWTGTCKIGGFQYPGACRGKFPNKVKSHPEFDAAAKSTSPGVDVRTKVRFEKGRWSDDVSLVHPVHIDST